MAVRELPRYTEDNPNYIYVENTSNFVNKMLKVDNVPDLLSTDTETYYNSTLRAPQAISKWIKGSRNNCPFGASFFTGTQGYWVDKDLHELDRLLRSPIPKTFHNSKYDLNMLKNIGLEVLGRIWDTMIMVQLIDEEFMCKLPPDEDGVVKYKKSKALKNLGYHFNLLGANAHIYEDLVHEYRRIIALNTGRSVNDVSYKEANDANPVLMKDYAVADTELGYHLFKILLPMLKEQDLEPVYDIDFNATLAVIDIERNGYMVDVEQMNIDERKLNRFIAEIDRRVHASCGAFNINSDLELVEQFRKFGMEWTYYTDTDEFCTDKNVMKELMTSGDARIVSLAKNVLLHRHANKLLSTYIIGIKQYIQEDGKVHPDFWVSPDDWDKGSTKTGRLSSSNPNFQNLVKKVVEFEDVEDEEDAD